jgi:hypothetical protein
MAGVVIPLGEEALSVSGVQIACWAGTASLPPGEPEDKRPAVVMGVADAATGTAGVATRPGAERRGAGHPRPEVPGLSKAGWFSAGADILGELWTPGCVRPTASLDGQTFAGCDARFL